jgi:hypothetical protein
VGERAEASQLYGIQAKLDGHQVYHRSEVEEFCKVFYEPSQKQSRRTFGDLRLTFWQGRGGYKAWSYSVCSRSGQLWRRAGVPPRYSRIEGTAAQESPS